MNMTELFRWESFVIWSRDSAHSPLVDFDLGEGSRGLEHFKQRISRSLDDKLPGLFQSVNGKTCFFNRWTGDDCAICIGYIISMDVSEDLLTHLEVLLSRLISMIEFFCGSPLNEDSIIKRAELIKELACSMLKLPMLSIVKMSNGELVSHVRKSISMKYKPAGQKVQIQLLETVSFILDCPIDDLRCRVEGLILVDNPLANDLVMEIEPKIQLIPGEHVPFGADDSLIPIQLGRYELARYASSDCPFELKLQEHGRLTFVWRSSSISDEVRVLKCQLQISCELPVNQVPKLKLDPPNLSHSVCFRSRSNMIKWDFNHLVAATQYSLSIDCGEEISLKMARLEFRLENCLVSGQKLDNLKVYQKGTGISADHQLEVSTCSISSTTLSHIRLSTS